MIERSGREQRSLLSIQILRAFAALAVTIEHIAGYEFARKYGLPDALPHFTFGAAGVDLFFVISGFVMVYSSDGYFGRPKAPQEFFVRRLARVLPLYWVTTSIILAPVAPIPRPCRGEVFASICGGLLFVRPLAAARRLHGTRPRSGMDIELRDVLLRLLLLRSVVLSCHRCPSSGRHFCDLRRCQSLLSDGESDRILGGTDHPRICVRNDDSPRPTRRRADAPVDRGGRCGARRLGPRRFRLLAHGAARYRIRDSLRLHRWGFGARRSHGKRGTGRTGFEFSRRCVLLALSCASPGNYIAAEKSFRISSIRRRRPGCMPRFWY